MTDSVTDEEHPIHHSPSRIVLFNKQRDVKE